MELKNKAQDRPVKKNVLLSPRRRRKIAWRACAGLVRPLCEHALERRECDLFRLISAALAVSRDDYAAITIDPDPQAANAQGPDR